MEKFLITARNQGKYNIEIKLKNNQHIITQKNLKKNIITDYETEAAHEKLNNITENGSAN